MVTHLDLRTGLLGVYLPTFQTHPPPLSICVFKEGTDGCSSCCFLLHLCSFSLSVACLPCVFFLDFTCPGGFRQAPQGLGPSVLRVEVTVVHLALPPFLWHIVLDPKLRAWVVPYLSVVIFQASAFWSVDRA